MDMATKIQYLTLDVISNVGLGEAFGDLKADEDINDYLKSCEIGLRIGNTAFALGTSWLREVPILGKRIGPSESDARGYGRMMAYVEYHHSKVISWLTIPKQRGSKVRHRAYVEINGRKIRYARVVHPPWYRGGRLVPRGV